MMRPRFEACCSANCLFILLGALIFVAKRKWRPPEHGVRAQEHEAMAPCVVLEAERVFDEMRELAPPVGLIELSCQVGQRILAVLLVMGPNSYSQNQMNSYF